MLQLLGNHDTVPDAIFQVAGQQGKAAAIEVKKGIEVVKLHARPEAERAKFISGRASRGKRPWRRGAAVFGGGPQRRHRPGGVRPPGP
jgi:hypothetical protein